MNTFELKFLLSVVSTADGRSTEAGQPPTLPLNRVLRLVGGRKCFEVAKPISA
jgi:hypothetical protein